MSQPIRYINMNTNHTFDFNYQRESLLLLLETLKKNDSLSAKIKKTLIEKAQNTLGLTRLPDSDRVTPFFHCQEGMFFLEHEIIFQTIELISILRFRISLSN